MIKIETKMRREGINQENKKENKNSLNIIACENMIRSSTFLKEEIQKYIGKETFDFMKENIGFPNSAVDRIVPPTDNEEDMLKVRGGAA